MKQNSYSKRIICIHVPAMMTRVESGLIPAHFQFFHLLPNIKKEPEDNNMSQNPLTYYLTLKNIA